MPYLAGGRLRAPGLLLGRGLLHGAGGRGGGGGPHLRLRLALSLGLLQWQVHAEGDGGGGAVLLKPVQVSAQEHMGTLCLNASHGTPLTDQEQRLMVLLLVWSYCFCY